MEKIIIVIIISIIIVLTTIFVMIKGSEDERPFIYEKIRVQANDTFWGYCGTYYQGLSYDRALYLFKQDNMMSKYSLKAGEIVKVRNYEVD